MLKYWHFEKFLIKKFNSQPTYFFLWPSILFQNPTHFFPVYFFKQSHPTPYNQITRPNPFAFFYLTLATTSWNDDKYDVSEQSKKGIFKCVPQLPSRLTRERARASSRQ